MKESLWINLIVGIWLIIAPLALATGMGVAAWRANDIVLGLLLIGFSWWMLAAMAPPVGAAWFEILCGIWLIVAPFVLGYSAIRSVMVNDVVCGIIAIVVAGTASQAIARRETVA